MCTAQGKKKNYKPDLSGVKTLKKLFEDTTLISKNEINIKE